MQGQEPITPEPAAAPIDAAPKPEDISPPAIAPQDKAEQPKLAVAPTEPSGQDIVIADQVDLPEQMQIPERTTNPEIINQVANTAEVASRGTLDKSTTAGIVQMHGVQAVRDQFATQQALGAESANMSQADKAAAAGDVAATVHYVKKADEAKNSKNDGALEEGAVRALTMGTPQQGSVTSDIAWKKQYFMNKIVELQHKYEEEGIGKKVGEFVLNVLPFSFNKAALGTGDGNALDHLTDLFDPQEFATANVTKLYSQNLGRDDFIKAADALLKKVHESSGFFGKENTSMEIQVLGSMLTASNSDRIMDKVLTVVDAGSVVTSGAKALVSAAKAAKGVGSAIKGSQALAKNIAKGDEIGNSGALVNTAKEVGRQDKAATATVQSFNSGKSNNLMNTVEAAHKNIAPIAEPNYLRDSTAQQSLNMDQFINRGVGSKPGEFENDRQIAEWVKTTQEIQQNRGFSPEEMEDAIAKANLKYSNQTQSLTGVAEHDIHPETFQPVVRTRITNTDGSGWNTEKQARDYFNNAFDTKNNISVVQDVNGKHVVVVDDTLDDLATMKDIAIKQNGIMRTINKIYYSPNNKSRTGSMASMVQPLDTIPKETMSQGITALIGNRTLIKIKNDILKRNTDKLSIKQRHSVEDVAAHYRDAEGYDWPGQEEIVDSFRGVTGKDPTIEQIKSFNDYKLLNDMDYHISNAYHHNLLEQRGFKQVRFNTENAELTNPIAKPLDGWKSIEDAPYIYDVGSKQFKTIAEETDFELLKEKGYQFYTMYDYAKAQGADGKAQRIKYIMDKAPNEEPLPLAVMPYRAGGRVKYSGEWFVKQPNFQEVEIRGQTKNLLHPPITHVISESRLDAERFMKKTNSAITKYKEVEAVRKAGNRASEKSLQELSSLWEDTRWGSLDAFESDLREGKATLHELEVVGDRQPLKNGEKYAPESTGRMANEDSDIEVLFNIARRGERKLDANGAPAALKSPFVALDEALSTDIKKFTFQRFVQDSSKRFHKTFAEDLTETYANPVNAIIHGTFRKGVDIDRVAIGTRYQAWLRNLARIGFTADPHEMDEMSKAFLELETQIDEAHGLNKSMARAKYGVYKWWKTSEPNHFFRGLMFKTTFGFYNFKQIITQSNTALMILLPAMLRDPIRGAKATGQFAGGLTEMGVRAIHDSSFMQMLLARNIEKDAKFSDGIAEKIGHKSKPSQLLKDYNESGIVNVQRYFGQPEQYDYAKNLASAGEGTAKELLRQAKKVGQKVSDNGDIFYNAGTQIGNFAGYTYARLKLLDKYGDAALVDGSRKRAEFLKELRYETERLTFGQSSVNNLGIQQASKDFGTRGLIVEMATQYMQYNIKLLSAVLPNFKVPSAIPGIGGKRIGIGSSSYSAAEKWSLGGTIAALTGSAALPFQNYISSEMYLKFRDSGWFDGTPQEWFDSWQNQGMVNEIINSTFGLSGDAKSTFGQQLSPWSQVEDFAMIMGGQKPLGGYIGGPMLNKVYNVFNKVAQYEDMQNTVAGLNSKSMGPYGIGALLAALEGGVTTAGNLKRFSDALKSDKVISRNGVAIARSNDTAAWLNLIGLTTQPYEQLEFNGDLLDAFKKDESQHENIIRNLMVQRTQLLNDEKFEEAEQVTMAIGAQMSMIPPNARSGFYRGAFKNFNHPVLEFQRQKIEKSLQFLDARNSQQDLGDK